jgi:hypothetical protein
MVEVEVLEEIRTQIKSEVKQANQQFRLEINSDLQSLMMEFRREVLSDFNKSLNESRQGLSRLMSELTDSLRSEKEDIFAGMNDRAEKSVHAIVNGKFDKILKQLNEITIWQNTHTAQSKIEIGKIEERISEVQGKTLYGLVQKGYKDKPMKTIIFLSGLSVFIVVLVLVSFHIPINVSTLKSLAEWVKSII